VLALAIGLFGVHMVYAARYGIFRDELYYVACGDHLSFGYVDHPPLVAVMARAAHAVFGESVRGLRVIPALCAAATVILAGASARALGGGRYAQVLAALAVVAAPEFLGTFHVLSMNCALPVAWGAAALFAIRAVRAGDARAWAAFGVACGVGLEAKHSTLFFGAAIAAGLVVTPARRVLATRGPWIAIAIAALLFAPNLVWEQIHGWPTLEFMANAQAKKMVALGPLAFARAQVENMNPLTFPIWAGGVAWLLAARAAHPFRFLGVAFVALFVIVLLGHGKPYYMAPIFPVVYGAGGVAIEARVRRFVSRAAIAAIVPATGALLAPFALPVLEPATFPGYAAALGAKPSPDEKHKMGPLPQFFADQFGWEAMARKVADAYLHLPPEEQRVAALYGENYGEASAIAFFGPRWGLPYPVSGHNAYFTWGPPEGTRGAVLIAVGPDEDDLRETYEEVEKVGETDEPYAMPFENHQPIFVCRRPKRPLLDVWPSVKLYI